MKPYELNAIKYFLDIGCDVENNNRTYIDCRNLKAFASEANMIGITLSRSEENYKIFVLPRDKGVFPSGPDAFVNEMNKQIVEDDLKLSRACDVALQCKWREYQGERHSGHLIKIGHELGYVYCVSRGIISSSKEYLNYIKTIKTGHTKDCCGFVTLCNDNEIKFQFLCTDRPFEYARKIAQHNEQSKAIVLKKKSFGNNESDMKKEYNKIILCLNKKRFRFKQPEFLCEGFKEKNKYGIYSVADNTECFVLIDGYSMKYNKEEAYKESAGVKQVIFNGNFNNIGGIENDNSPLVIGDKNQVVAKKTKTNVVKVAIGVIIMTAITVSVYLFL